MPIIGDLVRKGLNAKRESKKVEFKQGFDPRSDRDWCEIVKDVVAIANSGGGIIIFGLNSTGTPTSQSVDDIARLDPADIANKLAKYTESADLDFEVCELSKEGHKLVAFLIRAAPTPLASALEEWLGNLCGGWRRY
jgi:predicted HTH transcriptional regulator